MLRAVVLVLAAAALPAGAAPCYSVDAAHGRVSFELPQAGSPFRGQFRRFGGRICVGAEGATLIEVWLDPASIDSGVPEIDAALRGGDFFAVRQYPQIAFASQAVQMRGGAQLAHGVLQLKGKRRDLDVSFSLRRDAGNLNLSGSLMLNRLDYGIGTGEWSNTDWLGADVEVKFQARLSAE